MFIKKLQRTLRQTGSWLQTRYKEHVRSIRYIKDYTKYIRHVLNNQYLFGKIEEIMGKTDNIQICVISGDNSKVEKSGQTILEGLGIFIAEKECRLIDKQVYGGNNG